MREKHKYIGREEEMKNVTYVESAQEAGILLRQMCVCECVCVRERKRIREIKGRRESGRGFVEYVKRG